MTDEPYADSAHPDPELRAALATLLADEPPAPPVQDDVARGRVLLHRRRIRAGAVGGLAAIVLGVAATGALLRPAAPVAQPGQSASPSSTESTPTGLRGVAVATAACPASTSVAPLAESEEVAGPIDEIVLCPTGGAGPTDGLVRVTPGDGRIFVHLATALSAGDPSAATFIGCRQDSQPTQPYVMASSGAASWRLRLPLGQCGAVAGGVDQAMQAARTTLTPGGMPPCRAGDVKLIPDPWSSPLLGEGAMALQVAARNPEVRCFVIGNPEVQPIDADGSATLSSYLGTSAPRPVVVAQDTGYTVHAVLTWQECTSGIGRAASALRVTLPIDDTTTVVELPYGLGPVPCPGERPHGLTVGGFETTAEPQLPTPVGRLAPVTGLRGVPVSSPVCPAGVDEEVAVTAAITGEVARLWVCAPANPATGERSGAPVPLTQADGEEFTAFLTELRRADTPSSSTISCRAMAQGPRTVIVQADDGYWLAHLPRDACNFYSPALLAALDRATP
jgi:hypothetical protein